MNLTRTVAPAAALWSMEEVRAHLRAETADDDAFIASIMIAAEALLDGYSGILGRALVSQTWELRLRNFGGQRIFVPLPPLQSISSLTYMDQSNVLQTVAASVYQVVVNGDSGGWINLRNGKNWPTDVTYDDEGVRVLFIAGYGAAASDVPMAIRMAGLLLISSLYERRSADAASAINENPMVMQLLTPYRRVLF